MSNVLIGIIGVILFIGLALAGALILGDDFRSSKHDTKAAAIVQSLQQTSSAVSMYEMKTGETHRVGTSLTTLVPRFLKTMAQNPTGGPVARPVGAGGQNYSVPTYMIVMELINDAPQICLAIAQQASGATSAPKISDASQIPTDPVGCFEVTTVVSTLKAGSFYAYVRT